VGTCVVVVLSVVLSGVGWLCVCVCVCKGVCVWLVCLSVWLCFYPAFRMLLAGETRLCQDPGLGRGLCSLCVRVCAAFSPRVCVCVCVCLCGLRHDSFLSLPLQSLWVELVVFFVPLEKGPHSPHSASSLKGFHVQ